MYPYNSRVDWARSLTPKLIDVDGNFQYNIYSEIYAMFNVLSIEKMNDALNYEERAEQYSCSVLAMKGEAAIEKNKKKYACISSLARIYPNPSNLARLDYYRNALNILEASQETFEAGQSNWQATRSSLGLGRKVEYEYKSLLKDYRHKLAELEYRQAQIWLPPTWTYKILRFLGFSHEWLTAPTAENTANLRALTAVMQLAGDAHLASASIASADQTFTLSQIDNALSTILQKHDLQGYLAQEIQQVKQSLKQSHAVAHMVENLRALDQYDELKATRDERLDEICYRIQKDLAALEDGETYLFPTGFSSEEGNVSASIEVIRTGKTFSVKLHSQSPDISLVLDEAMQAHGSMLGNLVRSHSTANCIYTLQGISADELLCHRVGLRENTHLTNRFIRELLEPSTTEYTSTKDGANQLTKVFQNHIARLSFENVSDVTATGTPRYQNTMQWLSQKLDPVIFDALLLESNLKARETLEKLAKTPSGNDILEDILSHIKTAPANATSESPAPSIKKARRLAANDLLAKGSKQYHQIKAKLNAHHQIQRLALANLRTKQAHLQQEKTRLESDLKRDHLAILNNTRHYAQAAYLNQVSLNNHEPLIVTSTSQTQSEESEKTNDAEQAAKVQTIRAPSWFADTQTKRLYANYLQASKNCREAEQLAKNTEDDAAFLLKAQIAVSQKLMDVMASLSQVDAEIHDIESFSAPLTSASPAA